MKLKRVILPILAAIFLLSFSNRNVTLEKVWVFENYRNGISTYKHKARFSKNKSGIEFKSDGKLKIKQNSNWCGTEPISYEIADGN